MAEQQRQEQKQAAPVTMEAIQKLVSDSIASAIRPLADSVATVGDRFKAYEQNSATMMARRDYIEKNMKGLPSIYIEKMPNTTDVGELARAEQQLREQYRKDYGQAIKDGVAEPIDFGGGGSGGSLLSVLPPQSDRGGVSSVDKIQAGLRKVQ